MTSMSSTSFKVGLTEDARSSSRVLRPPGGGHTDIFAGPEPLHVKKDNGRNVSSILEGTNVNVVPSSPVKKTVEAPKMISHEAPVPQQRGRVPPGGFSSGLW